MTQALMIPTPATLAQAVEFGIGAWIHEKFGHTKSEKTKTAYSETITAFRQLLQREGLDLTWNPSEGESEAQVRQRLALYAQAFASTRLPGSRHKGEIAPASKNQRLAILSSFYQFANKRGFLTIGNPIDLVDRSPAPAEDRCHGQSRAARFRAAAGALYHRAQGGRSGEFAPASPAGQPPWHRDPGL